MGAVLLHQVLSDREMSQQDLEREIGCAQSLVCYWLSGKRVPSVRSAVLLEEHLGIEVASWTVEAGEFDLPTQPKTP